MSPSPSRGQNDVTRWRSLLSLSLPSSQGPSPLKAPSYNAGEILPSSVLGDNSDGSMDGARRQPYKHGPIEMAQYGEEGDDELTLYCG